jgi:hypothetical protein
MIVNVSSVKAFQRCRARWLYEYHMGRVPRQTSPALEFGKLLHVVFELHFQGFGMAEAMEKAATMWAELGRQAGTEGERQVILEAVVDLGDMREPLTMWEDKFPIQETLEVEEPYDFPHPLDPTITIRMRPDRVVRCFDKLFHVQNRSLSPGRNIGLYLELMREDMHELLYGTGLVGKYGLTPDQYGGTIFNIVKKLKYRSVPTNRYPLGKPLRRLEEMLVQHAIPILPAAQERALKDLQKIAMEMERTIEDAAGGVMPARNRELDGGAFGNRLDPYWKVFTGEATIWDDTLFKGRSDPYAPSATEEEAQ